MKYVTFSYDDGCRQDIRFTEILRKYNLKATFNLDSGLLGNRGRINHFGFDLPFDKIDPDEVKQVYEGFEVASHGTAHRNFPDLDDTELDREVSDDKTALEKLTGQPVIGAAYPCGAFDDRIADRLRSRGILYCRTIVSGHSFDIPVDFNLWNPTCRDHGDDALGYAEKFLKLVTDKDAVLYIWGHSFEFDKTDCDRWYEIEKLCEKLAGHKDITYATNGEIFRAITSRRA